MDRGLISEKVRVSLAKQPGRRGLGDSRPLDRDLVTQDEPVSRSSRGRTFWIERLGESGALWAAVRLAGALLRGGARPE